MSPFPTSGKGWSKSKNKKDTTEQVGNVQGHQCGGTEHKAAYILTLSVEVAIHLGKEQEAIRRNKTMAEYGWGRGFPAMF